MKRNWSQITVLSVSFLLIGPVVVGAENGQESQVNSTGNVQFKPSSETDPEGNSGPLRIESVSKIDFGVVTIKGDTTTYNAIYSEDLKEETSDELGVSVTNYLPLAIRTVDDRGSNIGWQLQISQTQQFTELAADGQSLKEKGSVLLGAEIKLSVADVLRPVDKLGETMLTRPTNLKQAVTINQSFQTLVSAEQNEGMGTWQTLVGEKVLQVWEGSQTDPNKLQPVENDHVQLTVPGETVKVKDGSYQAELTWILINTPETAS